MFLRRRACVTGIQNPLSRRRTSLTAYKNVVMEESTARISSLRRKRGCLPLFLWSNSQKPHMKQDEHDHDRQSKSANNQPKTPTAATTTSAHGGINLMWKNLPWPEIHRSRRSQGIMTGVDGEVETYRKTVGECEIEVGRHKHARDETVLLCAAAGDGCSPP